MTYAGNSYAVAWWEGDRIKDRCLTLAEKREYPETKKGHRHV
jgi:hypothetical protein